MKADTINETLYSILAILARLSMRAHTCFWNWMKGMNILYVFFSFSLHLDSFFVLYNFGGGLWCLRRQRYTENCMSKSILHISFFFSFSVLYTDTSQVHFVYFQHLNEWWRKTENEITMKVFAFGTEWIRRDNTFFFFVDPFHPSALRCAAMQLHI